MNDSFLTIVKDERSRDEYKNLLEQDEAILSMRKEADKLFELHQWDQCQPLYEKISESFLDDFWIQVKIYGNILFYFQAKTAISFTWGKESEAPKAEKYLIRLLENWPHTAAVYSVYGQNLQRQKRYSKMCTFLIK